MAHPEDFGLDDPKMVGASEYDAIYETLVDALNGCEEDIDDSPEVFAVAILNEFIDYATAMKRQIIKAAS
ncbi:hypothetical protein LCGC14_2352550 [marine sediment metagenome]|uniref:Uncharacterized protein n=1 Tax=marine sediment metagenome TaxID=412755 RepID=A0A0F9C9D1_9ZZZZ